MKTKIIYLTLMAAMLSLGACSNNDGEGNAPKYITVTANISPPMAHRHSLPAMPFPFMSGQAPQPQCPQRPTTSWSAAL